MQELPERLRSFLRLLEFHNCGVQVTQNEDFTTVVITAKPEKVQIASIRIDNIMTFDAALPATDELVSLRKQLSEANDLIFQQAKLATMADKLIVGLMF